jgi:hypothetical protein
MGHQTPELHAELSRLRASLKQSEQVQAELDRRVFHLKTLYNVSKDLFGSVEPETILRNGLLMADALRVSAHIPRGWNAKNGNTHNALQRGEPVGSQSADGGV